MSPAELRRHTGRAAILRRDLMGWFARPALVATEPRGMPIHPAERPAALLLVERGEAELTDLYLNPVTGSIPCA